MTPKPSGSNEYDIIVVGAGPAGAACACTAAKLGLRTALVDKARFPRDKLCGGGMTGRAIGHYRRIFDREALNVPFERRDSFQFFAFEENIGGASGAPPMHLISRSDFDAALVGDALEAGAVDFTGYAGQLDPAERTIRFSHAAITAPFIVAADGVNSKIAKSLFGQAFDRAKVGFALEVERAGRDPETPLRIDFGAAEWGYGWQFPKACGTTIGVGGVMSRNTDMKGALDRYLKHLGVTDPLKVKGQFLPFGEFHPVPGKDQILLAGDAAGLVDPITGEGLAHALHSGSLAAVAAAEALDAGVPESALTRYRKALRPIHASLRQARLLRHVLFRESLRPTFIRRFRQSKSLKSEYLQLLAGETEYASIMRGMLARMPGIAWRALRGT